MNKKTSIMKKLFFLLLIACLITACAGQGDRKVEEVQDPVEMSTELEEALQKNIELNERIEELEDELDNLLNN
jgi:uncharacterized protein YlxW (UPF0749 family)